MQMLGFKIIPESSVYLWQSSFNFKCILLSLKKKTTKTTAKKTNTTKKKKNPTQDPKQAQNKFKKGQIQKESRSNNIPPYLFHL